MKYLSLTMVPPPFPCISEPVVYIRSSDEDEEQHDNSHYHHHPEGEQQHLDDKQQLCSPRPKSTTLEEILDCLLALPSTSESTQESVAADLPSPPRPAPRRLISGPVGNVRALGGPPPSCGSDEEDPDHTLVENGQRKSLNDDEREWLPPASSLSISEDHQQPSSPVDHYETDAPTDGGSCSVSDFHDSVSLSSSSSIVATPPPYTSISTKPSRTDDSLSLSLPDEARNHNISDDIGLVRNYDQAFDSLGLEITEDSKSEDDIVFAEDKDDCHDLFRIPASPSDTYVTDTERSPFDRYSIVTNFTSYGQRHSSWQDHKSDVEVRLSSSSDNYHRSTTSSKHGIPEPDDSVIVRCSHDQCRRSAELRDARGTFQTCPNCYTYYCSRECRTDSWARHRRTCTYGRIRNTCKQVLRRCYGTQPTLLHLSRLAREGVLQQGRGFLRLLFRDTRAATYFVKSDGRWPNEEEPVYFAWSEEILHEMGDEVCSTVGDLCSRYEPESKFVLLAAIRVTDKVPRRGAPQRAIVAKCARVPLHKSMLATADVIGDAPDSWEPTASCFGSSR